MTTEEVDRELERLFGSAREATLPDAGAKERIRALLTPQLASGGTTGSAIKRPAWLALGAGVIGLCAGALWLMNAPETQRVAPAPSAVSQPAPAPAAPLSVSALPEVARLPEPTPSAKPRSLPPAAVSKPAPSVEATDPAEELTLVRAMQQALRAGNSSQALTLADEHARRFPRGTLGEEREGVRAVARCRLAAPVDRAAILEAFSSRFGGSPYAARVKQACQ